MHAREGFSYRKANILKRTTSRNNKVYFYYMSEQRFNRTLIPRPKNRRRFKQLPVFGVLFGMLIIVGGTLFSFPSLLTYELISSAKDIPEIDVERSFPVTVFPSQKIIVENDKVEAFLLNSPGTQSAAVLDTKKAFTWFAVSISRTQLYRQVAGIAGIENLYVTIYSGYREEQVARAFGETLDWNAVQRKDFLKEASAKEPDLTEGIFVPGTYFVGVTDPSDVADITHERFLREIRARYGTTTEEQVPLDDALTIASLLQREAAGWDDMRIISGIIWNRLFIGMNLQIDATLQYAKASNKLGTPGKYWEIVVPKDKFIKSAYNTYQNKGLPPGPISNASIAAILAALNPKRTDCLFYFHDKYGKFHCSPTYEGHVALLIKAYGQGK